VTRARFSASAYQSPAGNQRITRCASAFSRNAPSWGRVGAPLAVVVIYASLCFLVGCHPSNSDNQAATSATTDERRTLRRGNGPEPDSLDPQKARTSEGQTILRDLFECLTSLDHEGRPAPGGAESWAVSPDGKTYTFTLRSNARWSNGDRVTATDFVSGLRRLVDPATASENGALIDVVVHAHEILAGTLPPDRLGVSAPNASTVVIELEHPAAYLPGLLAHPSTCPIHLPTGARTDADVASHGVMVSNGAFALSEWVPGQHIVAKRNPYYWNNQHTYWDRVIYLHIMDANAEFMRYRTGEIQMTAMIPRPMFESIQHDFPHELHVYPGLGTYYYGFNLDRALFRDNPKVRQALTLAIDRERLAQQVLRTGERAAYSWVPNGVLGYTPVSPPYQGETLDDRIRRARQLLKEAGYSSARPLRFELRYNVGETHTRLALAVTEMWKEALGAEVRITAEDFRALLTDIDAGQVEMFRLSWNADYNDPLAFLQILRSDSGLNLTHYRSARFDRLLDRASAETDPARRMQLLQEAEQTVLDDAPLIPIYFHAGARLVKPTIRGWYSNVMGGIYSKELSLAPAQ
jgi:oligopeptide transport system substrate-binding protein